MQPKVLLRIAAVAIGLIAFGHSFGGMQAPSHGPEEDAVIAALAAYRFDMMGTSRSHYELYRGEGWFVSLTMVGMAVLAWMLSNAAGENPALVKKLSLLVALFYAGSTFICMQWFFIAPLALSVVASLAAFAAFMRLKAA